MMKDSAFFLQGNNVGILLIHGLTGTPNEMRSISRHFHRAGYSALAVQLAGHCGDINDLIQTRWEDWYESVCAGAEKLKQYTDEIFVAGLSMGSLLALKYASEHAINGVIAYSPIFQYDGWSIPFWSRVAAPIALPIAAHIPYFKHHTFDEMEPYGIQNEMVRHKIVNSMQGGDSSKAGLPGNPWSSLYELQKLSRNVKKNLKKITSPCLCLHAYDDDIAHRRNSEYIYKHVQGPKRLVWLYKSYHMITIDNDRKQVMDESLKFVKEFSTASECDGP